MATQTTNFKLEKPADTDFYDIQVHNRNADKIDAAIKAVEGKIPTNIPPDLSGEVAKKLNKRTAIDATISAASWTGASAPYTANIPVTQLTGAVDELVEVYVPHTATLAQKQAWSEAGIVSGNNAKGALILEAIMEKPKVDIPIKMLVGGV